MKKNYALPTQIFNLINLLIMAFIIFVTLAPFLNIVAKSFSAVRFLDQNAVTFYPKGFNTSTYHLIMSDSVFWINYRNTIFYTVFGTLISLCMSVLLAYPLSVPRLKGKALITTFILVTMFFGGGMIPNYVLVKTLGMRNTIWSILIPGAISTYNVIVMRTFFENIPRELEEAAVMDGMNTYGILWKIVVPLSKPILATMTLFYAVGFWNSWFPSFLYLDKSDMYPVIIYLRNIISGASLAGGQDTDAIGQVGANIKAVCIVLTSVPILCIYPFLQRYFVQGMMIGSVKA
jgi:putative aldouronate transport system permease protein